MALHLGKDKVCLSQIKETSINNTSLNVTTNGVYTIGSQNIYTGYSTVTVNIPTVNNTSVVITENGTYVPEDPFTGFNEVQVTILPKLQTKTITENGTYTCDDEFDGFSTISVNVDTVNNTEIEITENGEYIPGNDFTGYSKVTVNVTPNLETLLVTENNKVYTNDNGFSEVYVSIPEKYTKESIKITENGIYSSEDNKLFNKITVDVKPELEDLIVIPKKTKQRLKSVKAGFNTVIVDAVTKQVDENIKAENIKEGVAILGVKGTLKTNLTRNKDIVIANPGVYDVPEGYTGFGTVIVDPQVKEMWIYENGEYEIPAGYVGYGKLHINVTPPMTINQLTLVGETLTNIIDGYTVNIDDDIPSNPGI